MEGGGEGGRELREEEEERVGRRGAERLAVWWVELESGLSSCGGNVWRSVMLPGEEDGAGSSPQRGGGGEKLSLER
jgi:hypothetical protein